MSRNSINDCALQVFPHDEYIDDEQFDSEGEDDGAEVVEWNEEENVDIGATEDAGEEEFIMDADFVPDEVSWWNS